ncbi:putative F-box/LRR-repeat protein At4g15060 isoform X2 [Salvia splendens]|uniref:putative F-box/LRR-repeat protein At4g15060 isoform X2 n=1 Tax=Salvia splendens TaxID=180675 RepID=UPI001C27E3A1|nr:putative F-box/LRR-repeat protein At4g15060 isoform X2 [Salvia splendens]
MLRIFTVGAGEQRQTHKQFSKLMDGRDCNKRTKRECGSGFRVDRISGLPDEIIYIILSFLPLRQAAATSLLSHRWQHLWKHTSNLDFYDPHTIVINRNSWRAETCRHVKIVNLVLESHQALFIKQFTISIYVNKSAHSTITKWLKFAQLRRVERLDLNFHCMNLSGRRAVVLEDLVREMRPMKYLKALSLDTMKVSGQDISYFLKSCPLLRELNITTSSFTSDVHVFGDLEILRIRGCIFRKFAIEISAPHLYEVVADSYELISDAKTGALRFKNVPRLAIASLEIGNLRYNAANFASAVSCFTSHLQKLILFIPSSKHKIFLRERLPHMPNLKELYVVVSCYHVHHCIVPVTSIISACPRLQMFTFKFYICEDIERFPGEFSKYYLQTYGCKRSHVFECPHQRLRMLKFQGSCATDIIKSMTYISTCCDAYQKINTCTPHMSETEAQAHIGHMQQLQSQLPHQVEFEFR